MSASAYTISSDLPRPVRLPEARFPMLERPRFRWVGEVFSAIEPVMNCWNKDIVARLRRIDPDYLPLVVRSVYRSQLGAEFVFERHVSAYQTHTPYSREKIRTVMWPSLPGSINYGRHTRGAVVLEDIWETPKPEGVDDGLPGDYRPYDGRYSRAWIDGANDQRSGTEQAFDYVDRDARKLAKARRELFDRIDYEGRADEQYDRNLAQKVSGPEIDAAGTPVERPRKPFVHVKGCDTEAIAVVKAMHASQQTGNLTLSDGCALSVKQVKERGAA